ncbi:hypothetical protein UU5_03297 [Rhodanobacter sp. 115]|nr:hypothetical protein UU5_03297 [Rhodanobacter sp. 115]
MIAQDRVECAGVVQHQRAQSLRISRKIQCRRVRRFAGRAPVDVAADAEPMDRLDTDVQHAGGVAGVRQLFHAVVQHRLGRPFGPKGQGGTAVGH